MGGLHNTWMLETEAKEQLRNVPANLRSSTEYKLAHDTDIEKEEGLLQRWIS